MNIPVLRIKDENGQYQDIPAIKGAKGDKGDPGTNGVNGGYYEPSVSSSGDLSWTPSKSGMPDVATSNIKGPQGEQGPTGQTGPKGDTPNVTVGTTTTSDPGGDASVTKNSSSTEDNAIFDFVIPRGEQGPQGNPGSDGKSPTVNVGTTTTGPAGSQASVTNSGTETDAVFNFTIPVGIQGQRGEKGDTGSVFTPSVDADGIISWTNNGGLENPPSQDIKGPKGDKGDSATITIGTTTTGNEGTNATVTNTGTSSDAVFNFTIPRGNTGAQGEAATINVGTTETISPGTSAEVSNSGTSSNAVFNFKIPRGEKGDTGDTGATPSINVGTTTTGNPGTEASVTKDKSSTETNVIFDFTIPRGDKGETGEQGIKGDKGDTGVTFTPSVSQDGIISWTNDGDLKNPSSVDIKGDKGDAATVSIGSTVTTEPGTSASVTNTGTSNDAIFNFSIPKGEKGDKGETGSVGPQGQSATIEVGSTVTSQPGSKASVTNSGTSSAAVFNFTIPEGQKGNPGNDGEKGDPGAVFTPSVSDEGIISWTNNGDLPNPTSVNIRGPQGIQGSKGDAATVSVGETTTVDPGTEASVTNSGTSSAAVFNFSIPKGEKGDQGIQGNKGDPGEAATIEIGTTTTGLPGSQASVTNSGTSEKAVFNFSIPKGEKGNTGDTGPRGEAATVSVGTTTTGDPGGSASVTNSGTSSDAVFNFVIPRGQQGTPGQDGITPTISAGTTTTGDAGTNASVTKDPSSTDENVVLNFTIPRGVSGVYYGSSPSNEDSVWIDPTSSSPTKLEVPIGSIVALASESLIDNNSMLLCDGRSVSKSTYSDLYSAIGDKYGSTDTTFNLPNLTGRFIRGNTTAGGTGGSASIQLTVNNIPGHTHSISISTLGSGSHDHSFSTSTPEGGDHLHSITGETGEAGSHTHTYRGVNATAGLSGNYGAYPIRMYEDKKDNWTGPQTGGGINSAGSHSHSIALNASQGSHSHLVTGDTDTVENHTHEVQGDTGSAGSGEEIDSLPPYIDLVFAIKYSSEISSPVLKVKNEETGEWIGIESIKGTKGDTGAVFTPSVSSEGIISWTNDGGLPNPSPQNIRGPQGQNGSPGLYVGNSAPSDANIRLWVKPVDDYVFSYSNPNLLINSNFIDPINQRGEATYSGNAYGIDRWKGATVGSSVDISGSGVLITGQITQYVEMKSSNIGRTMTMSSCDSNGNIKSITGELDTSSVSGNNMSFVYNGSKYSIAASIGGGTRYRWVKLEFGSSPTLYVPRSRAEEVMLCLRYYWRIQQTNSDFNYFGGGIANDSSNTYFTINLPVYMRDFPELGYGGNFQCYGGNGNFPIGSLAESPFTSTTDPIDDQTSTYTLMAVRNGGSQTAGHVYNLNGTTPGSYIEFDSEIY